MEKARYELGHNDLIQRQFEMNKSFYDQGIVSETFLLLLETFRSVSRIITSAPRDIQVSSVSLNLLKI